MPTARELLEQADALMRRNRTDDFEPEIPELTDEVSVAGSAVPARVSPKPPPSGLGLPRGRRGGAPESDNAVGGVKDPSIQSLSDHRGEDSRWLDVDLGDASVTGLAPDSIAVVPPSTLRSPRSAPKADAPPLPVAESREGAATSPPTPAAALAAKVAGTLSGPWAEPPPERDAGFDAMLGMAPADVTFGQELAPLPEAPTPAPEVAKTPEPFVVPDFEQALAPVPTSPTPAPEVAGTPEPFVVPDTSAAVEAAAANFPDAQRWEGLAEEIRMQVLQRIDIFTDTGLHGELSARLQPIVDRASADLLTTINREVGQILRAYVAEAIEREIEKWRDANP